MERLKKYVTLLFGEQLPIQERFYNFASLGGAFASVLATLACVISKVGTTGILTCIACIAFFLVAFFAYRITKKLQACIVGCLLGLNILIFPALYFTVGGIKSGMPIYFVMGLVFTVLMLDIKPMIVMLIVESIWYILVFRYSYLHPEVSDAIFVMSDEAMYLDQAMDFFVVALSTSVLVKALALCFEYQQKRTNELLKQLEELSVKDPLSGAYNRRFLLRYIESGIAKHKDTRAPLSIIMFDIDKFKRVNDDYGHLVGDDVIKGFSGVLLKSCRNYDVVARYGGEEFILVMPGASEETAYARAEQIRKRVEKASFSEEIDRPITVSGGVASYDIRYQTVEEFISIADEYLYTAKETGRNKIVWKGSQDRKESAL